MTTRSPMRELHDSNWRMITRRRSWQRASGAAKETVEEYLARGGVVTRCPTVFLLPSVAGAVFGTPIASNTRAGGRRWPARRS